MRRAVWPIVLCLFATGCHTDRDGPFAFLRPAKPVAIPSKSPYSVGGFGNAFGNAIAPDQTPGVYLESVLFERPVGDPLLDRDLWANASSPLPPKTRALLEENGLRVVAFAGNLPRAFQKLLESESEAVNPQGLTFASRTDAVLPTVGPIEKCEFRVLTDLSGSREKVELRTANGGILVKPEATADGRVKVVCEPRMQHGERQDWIRPTSDSTGFSLQGEIPLERYPGLGFDVTLGPGEYLVIGSPATATETLGSAMFGVEAKSESRQRVLVIRAGIRGEARTDLPALPRSRGGHAIAVEASRW